MLKFIPLSDLTVGDVTVMRIVTGIEFSKSGKTATVTVMRRSGKTLSDRRSASAKIAIVDNDDTYSDIEIRIHDQEGW